MDENLKEKMDQKIKESLENKEEILKLAQSLSNLSSSSNSFSYGVMIGRLYNSFYYQCRRILKRNPTETEFEEFLAILKSKQTEFTGKI